MTLIDFLEVIEPNGSNFDHKESFNGGCDAYKFIYHFTAAHLPIVYGENALKQDCVCTLVHNFSRYMVGWVFQTSWRNYQSLSVDLVRLTFFCLFM